MVRGHSYRPVVASVGALGPGSRVAHRSLRPDFDGSVRRPLRSQPKPGGEPAWTKGARRRRWSVVAVQKLVTRAGPDPRGSASAGGGQGTPCPGTR